MLLAPAGQPNGQIVLVVDDEPSVRTLMVTVLQHAGYRTLAAGSGAEALRLAEAHESRVDLLLTDIVMPGMDGWELARRLGDMHPRTKVLYISGDTGKIGDWDPGVAAFLNKPFTASQLLQAVKELLEHSARKGCAGRDWRPGFV